MKAMNDKKEWRNMKNVVHQVDELPKWVEDHEKGRS
jgi:hypothetical protein